MTRFSILACLYLAALTACVQDGPDREPKIHLSVRPDAVEPSGPLDYEISLNGAVRRDSNAAAGKILDLGMVSPETKVVFRVFNRHGAGSVRAHILTDNCFRHTGSCEGKDCVAEASYTVVEEGCPNF